MPKTSLYNMEGAAIGEVELSEELFAAPINTAAMHLVVRSILANQRQGTQSALTRSEVSGGGIKPWRQKGTGNARQGSTRSPQWRHGGVVFAPKPRDYRLSMNKKAKRLAMKSALSDKAMEESIVIFDNLGIEAPKTREMVQVLKNVDVNNALIVLSGKDETVERAARNIPGIKTTIVGTLNPYDILKHRTLILTADSLKMVEEVYD